MSWIEAHPLAGSTLASTGESGRWGKPYEWSAQFALPAVAAVLVNQGTLITVTAAKAGGTAVRVDGYATWTIPRPAAETIPAGEVVSVAVYLKSGGTLPLSTITARWKVRRLVTLVNSSQLAPTGARSCPIYSGVFDLRFMPAHGTTPVARAVEGDCETLAVTVNGQTAPALNDVSNLAVLLQSLGALPNCRSNQLRANAGAPTAEMVNFRRYRQRYVTVNLIDTSGTGCALTGFPRITLEDSRGRPLATHQPYPKQAQSSSVQPALLAPGGSTGIDIEWMASDSCRMPVVAMLGVNPSGAHGQLQTHAPHSRFSFRPCNAYLPGPLGS